MSAPFERGATLAAVPGVRHGFFGRRGGASGGVFASLNVSDRVGDSPELVAENRARAATSLGFPARSLALVRQVHSSDVAVRSSSGSDAATEADAMVTSAAGVVLGILTADCVPVLLADPEARVVGAAHAGWKGAAGGIVGATVRAMCGLGADPARIVAAIGPAISFRNYEVGPQFAADLLARQPSAASRIGRPDGGREHFDLPGFVADQLRAAGVAGIDELGICTYAAPDDFFSHRHATHAGLASGRQIALIGLA